jgi:hypothetical protein
MKLCFCKRIILATGLLVSVCGYSESSPPDSFGVEAGIRYSMMTPGGSMGTMQNGVSQQTSLSDLGIEGAEGSWGVSLGLRYKRANLYVSGQQSSYSGRGTTAHDITQDGITIPAGTPVETTMDLGIYSAIVTYNVIDRAYKVGLGLGLMGLDFGVEYDTGLIQVPIDETIYLPLVAASLSYDWNRLEVEGLVGGAAVNMNGEKVAYIDLDIALRYTLIQREHIGAQVALGYKYIAMDMELSADSGNAFEADLNFTGPYVGLRFMF